LNGRISYVVSYAVFRGVEAKYKRERYIPVAAIMIATIEGSKNNCVKEKRVASTIGGARKDVPS